MFTRYPAVDEQLIDPSRDKTFSKGKSFNQRSLMLLLQIGIGYGKCAILYVGGVFNRNESFTIGEALSDALKSEGMASAGG